MIQIDSEDDEAAEEKKEGEEGDPTDPRASPAPEVIPEKDSKLDNKKPEKGIKGKKGSTQEEAPPVQEVDPNKKPDPNANKFVPGAIHLRRELVATTNQLQ